MLSANTIKLESIISSLAKITGYLEPLAPHLNALNPAIPTLLAMVDEHVGQMFSYASGPVAGPGLPMTDSLLNIAANPATGP